MKEINNENSIGKIISKLRKDKGLTQAQLAEKLNVSDKTISKWEQDSGSPSIEFFPALANLFNVTIDYLMTGKEPEERIITMSKIELCAKKDDPSVLDDFSFNSAKIKDENGLTLMDYIKKYNSLKVFRALIDDCSHQTHYQSLFPQSKIDLPELLALIKIDREKIVLKNITNSADTIRLNLDNLTSDSIWKNTRNKTDISEGYKNIIKYLIENYDNLTQEQQEYYFNLNGEGGLLKKNCWSFAYPYFIDVAYTYNKKILEKLLIRIEEGNKYYKSELAEIRKMQPCYESFSCRERDMANNIKNNYAIIYPLESTALTMLEDGNFELAERLNKQLKNAISCDKFEHAKIMKNKKISEKKKQQLLCIHNGILNIDELLKLNDFKVVKQMLEEYPICLYEKLMNLLTEKKYKDLFKCAVDCNLIQVAQFVLREQYSKLQPEIEKLKELSEKNEFYKFEKENYKYIKKASRNNSTTEQYEGLYNFEGVMAKNKSEILYNLALKIDKNKISSGLNKAYFENELTKGNEDIVIVKLCVKLEAILKCDYHYTGTFEEMLNQFCSKFNTYDDYGNDYDPYTPTLLNKLRKMRNNIVHSEINDVALSQKEIKDCIDYICKLDKED